MNFSAERWKIAYSTFPFPIKDTLMHLATRGLVSISLLLSLVMPIAALAFPTITCHCFTDRSIDPGHPKLADPYFLATTQNSFFSAVFATSKMVVVLKKQLGNSADDLWIASGVASKSRAASAEALLKAKRGKGSWPEVIAQLGIPGNSLGSRFAEDLKNRPSSESLARAVVDGVLVERGLLGETDVAALRRAGGTNQELILAALIARKRGQRATEIFTQVKRGTKSWGELMEGKKFDLATIRQYLHGVKTVAHPPSPRLRRARLDLTDVTDKGG
jgi:hypothetical protein